LMSSHSKKKKLSDIQKIVVWTKVDLITKVKIVVWKKHYATFKKTYGQNFIFLLIHFLLSYEKMFFL
jgi:ribosome biogenesis GTPase A